MGYTIQPKKRIDLSEFGTDNNGIPFFVEVMNVNSLPYEKKMKYLATVAEVYKGTDFEKIKNKDFSGMSIDTSKLADLKKNLQSLITAWNLIDFDEKPVNCTDADALDRVPGFIVDAISTKMSESNQAQAEETKNS